MISFILFYFIIINLIIECNTKVIGNYNTNFNPKYILPKIFLLGPMKSGSSSLFKNIIKHPNVCSGIRKEINFLQIQNKITNFKGKFIINIIK